MAITNSQYDEIMRGYDRLQVYHQNLRLEHINEIYKAIPRIKAIDDEISSLSASRAKMSIRGLKGYIEEYRKQVTELTQEKDQLLLENGYPVDYMELTYSCEKCHDTGYVNGQKCSCFKNAVSKLLYNQSGLTSTLEKENFDTLSYAYYSKDMQFAKRGHTVYENMDAIIKKCHQFVDKFTGENGGNILFTGSAGCGKTFLSNCIAKALIDKQYSVVYVTAIKMFDLLAQQQFGRKQEEENIDVDQYLLECDLLIIDDLGTEINNAFVSSKFLEIMNERLIRDKSMIISTNLPLSEIRNRYTDRVYSRIVGYFMLFDFYGPDIRFLTRRKR
jgi:DNA replication protein DnaC